MSKRRRDLFAVLAVECVILLGPKIGLAAGDTPGVTGAEIKIGQTMPYSGPASAASTVGVSDRAYFAMVNDQGGVNGRKIDFISVDDGLNPAKTVEQTRRLVEVDQVAFTYRALGTATQSAVVKYLNDNKVPQLMIASGAAKWNQPSLYPWSIPSLMDYVTEAHIYARYILKTQPNARIAVLYQNDDFGKDYLRGLEEGLGDRAKSMIVKSLSYETTDPTVDSQILDLHGSGADTVFLFAYPRPIGQALRKISELGWKPRIFLDNPNSSIGFTLKPAGVDKAVGVITIQQFKDPSDPRWKGDADIADWNAWMAKYNKSVDRSDGAAFSAYGLGWTMTQILRRCGTDLSRENIMRQALSLKSLAAPMLIPGITYNTSPTDHRLLRQGQLARFDGKSFVPLDGTIIGD
ncbi:MAG TPA: ABC transporter substrate-binding protein [Stellaceae bacterium]|nr:ABC transporter substrate-binding protein [Stellaceae bacterium]